MVQTPSKLRESRCDVAIDTCTEVIRHTAVEDKIRALFEYDVSRLSMFDD